MRTTTPLAAMLGLAAAMAVVGCAAGPPAPRRPGMVSTSDLVFVTRDGCVNTGTMRARLDEALAAMGLPADYEVLDADTLDASDPRGGYGTPTVLYSGRDLFGMPEPAVPHPEPT